jgi:hypothetical protein
MPPHSCLLCGQLATPKPWTRELPEVKPDHTAGGSDEQVQNTTTQETTIHPACWEILERVARARLEKYEYDAFWLKMTDFRESLEDMRPFLRYADLARNATLGLCPGELQSILATPGPGAPPGPLIHDADDSEKRGSEYYCLPPPPPPLPRHAAATSPRSAERLVHLPPELLGIIYSFLTASFSDVSNLRTATGLDPPLGTWKLLWRKYEDWDLGEACEDDDELLWWCAKVEHVLRIMQEYKGGIYNYSPWPDTACYTVVWENCELVLKFFSTKNVTARTTRLAAILKRQLPYCRQEPTYATDSESQKDFRSDVGYLL